MEKRRVLRGVLNEARESHSRRLEGKLFHRIGVALAKARSPYVLSHGFGTLRRDFQEERREKAGSYS